MYTANRNPKKVCATIGLGLFTMMISWIVLNTVLMLVFAAQVENNGLLLWLFNDIPLYFVGVPLFLLFMRSIPDGVEYQRAPLAMNIRRYVLLLLFCFGATYLLSMVGAAISQLVILIKGGSDGGLLAMNSLVENSSVPVNFIFGAIIPAFGEEFIFRYMLRRKLKGSGDKVYMVVSALAFALFHGNHIQGLFAFVIGLAFAWIYANTGKLWHTISLHFIINTIGIVIAPAVSTSEVGTSIFGLFVVLCIVAAIILFFLYRKKVKNSLMPPSEAGWPYKSPYPLQAYGVGGAPSVAVGVNFPGAGGVPQPTPSTTGQPFGRPKFSYSNFLPVLHLGKPFVSYTNMGQTSAPQPAPSPAQAVASSALPTGYAYSNMPSQQSPAYANSGGNPSIPVNTNSNTRPLYYNSSIPAPVQPPMPQGQGLPPFYPGGYPAQPPLPQYYGGVSPYGQAAGQPYYPPYYGGIPQGMQPRPTPYGGPYRGMPQPVPQGYVAPGAAYQNNPYGVWQGMPAPSFSPNGFVPPLTKRPSFAGVCFANVGMILYFVLSGLLILLTMAAL